MADNRTQMMEDHRKASKILKELRTHQQEIEDDKDDAEDVQKESLRKHFEQADENLAKTETADHALVDAQIFHRLSQYTKKQAEHLQSGLRSADLNSFSDKILLNSQKRLSQQEEEEEEEEDDEDEYAVSRLRPKGIEIDFHRYAYSFWRRSKATPVIDFMFGSAPRENDGAKEKTERKTRQANKGSKVDRPKELRPDQVEQTETDKEVANMKKELEKLGKINFWHFVIDPEDFTRSVENIFHSSFLVKDAWAQLNLKKDPPILSCRNPDDEGPNSFSEHGQEDRVEHSEFILEFDRVLWNEMIEKYKIRKCMLPRLKERRKDAALERVVNYEQGDNSS